MKLNLFFSAVGVSLIFASLSVADIITNDEQLAESVAVIPTEDEAAETEVPEDMTHNEPVVRSVPTPAPAEETPEMPAADAGWVDKHIKGHLEVGLRWYSYDLDDTDRPDREHSFLGSIDRLEDDQDAEMPWLFVNYMVTPYVGLGLTMDEIRAKTITKSDGHTDGTVELSGPVLSLIGRYPNQTRVTPFAEVGLAFFSGTFDHDPDWYAGGRRVMYTEDDDGTVLMLGADIRVYKDLQLQLFWRQVDANAPTEYYLLDPERTGEPREAETFPMSYDAFGFSLLYPF